MMNRGLEERRLWRRYGNRWFPALWVTLGLTAIALSQGCSGCDDAGKGPGNSASPPGSAASSLFDESYEFVCSPKKEAGCKGVLPVHDDGDTTDGGTTDRPSEVAILGDGQEAFR
ncbi:MAG: hypothetical protein JRI68_22065, partial [Deltaproteobacteria bacterium]|nr:hypothetical protein [Deltaproteobacteria bacterium]